MTFQELKSLFFSAVKWSQKQLVNGMLIEYDGDQIAKSSIIYQISPDGLKAPLPDGEYKTKEGVLFILKDGKVSSVESAGAAQAPPSNEPVKQAQSSQETESNPKNDPMSETKVKASDEEMAKQPAIPAPDADQASDQPDYATILATALAPIAEALKAIQASLGTTSAMATETKEELSKVKTTVAKLADEPAPEKKEPKKPVNPFNANKDNFEDITASKTYNVLKAGAVKK